MNVRLGSKRLILDIGSLIAVSVSWGIVLAFAFSEWVRADDGWKVMAVTALLLAVAVAATAFRLYRTYLPLDPATDLKNPAQ